MREQGNKAAWAGREAAGERKLYETEKDFSDEKAERLPSESSAAAKMEAHPSGGSTVAKAEGHPSGSSTATKRIVEIAMFTAVTAVLSQISIPLPSGVPVTLQTFAIALAGVVLGWKYAVASTAVYILLGAVGVPVFAGFSGGAQVLVNYTGGFIWGFLFMSALCGVGSVMKHKYAGIIVGIAGLAVCHVLGVLQFMAVMGMGAAESFALASAPYIIKDVISVILAYVAGWQIRRRLLKAGLL